MACSSRISDVKQNVNPCSTDRVSFFPLLRITRISDFLSSLVRDKRVKAGAMMAIAPYCVRFLLFFLGGVGGLVVNQEMLDAPMLL